MTIAADALHLRRYLPSDHDAVWALHNLALAGTGAHLGNGAWDDDLHHIAEVYLDGTGEFLVGVVAGEVVAMGALQRKQVHVAAIRRMRVRPAWQGRGYGGEVLLALEARAEELGYSKLVLDTTTLQTGAIAFYTARGYTQYDQGEVGHFTVLYFEKDLPATSGQTRPP
jgi:GNAT superfamily N-acetyltransferase